MNRPFSHCTQCGEALAQDDWPCCCDACGATHFLNPLPVSVLLLPTKEKGLIAVRRSVEPQVGELALPGGFVNLGESWQEAAAREIYEETQIVVEADTIKLFDAISAPDGAILIFGLAPPVSADAMSAFEPNPEVSELVHVRNLRELAFPLHTEILEKWFLERSQ